MVNTGYAEKNSMRLAGVISQKAIKARVRLLYISIVGQSFASRGVVVRGKVGVAKISPQGRKTFAIIILTIFACQSASHQIWWVLTSI